MFDLAHAVVKQRLELVGHVLRAAHCAWNFEHHEQGRQGKDVAQRIEATVLAFAGIKRSLAPRGS